MSRKMNWTTIGLVAAVVGLTTPAGAGLIWFDATRGGDGYEEFGALTEAYEDFVGLPEHVLTFEEFGEGTKITDEYAESFGATLLNTANGRYAQYSGVRKEGGAIAEHITGYDGTYQAHGSKVYTKFDNDLADTPFTIQFDSPVALVGAFVGMGVQGNVHSLSISAYGADDTLLGSTTVDAWLWESKSKKQNYESFFALDAGAPVVSRVEIRNDASNNFANALLIDNIAFDAGTRVTQVPEPVSLVLMTGMALLLFRWRKAAPTARAA